MKIMKISFVRKFELNTTEIEKVIKNYGTLEINSNILLNLDNIKKYLRYIPIKSNSNEFVFSHPLGSIKRINNNLIYAPFEYGNIEDLLSDSKACNVENSSNILIGNSASPTNNHVDAFKFIVKFKQEGQKIIVPLS